MDNIIALIVVIIAIVSALSKAKTRQKSKQTANAPESNELAAKLKTFFAQVQERLNTQSRQGAGGASAWGPLMQAEKDKEPPEHYDMSLEDLVLEEEPAPAKVEKRLPARPTMAQAKPVAPQATSSHSGMLAEKPLASKTSPDVATLRRALIWSEILGPPVALRDPGD